MPAVLSFLVVVAAAMVVAKIATVALVHTGMSGEAARFQVRSAVTGVGVTTAETAAVVRHPVRRRIVMALMILGNVGVVLSVSTLVLSFTSDKSSSAVARLGGIVAGLAVLGAVAGNAQVNLALSRLIGSALHRWTRLGTRDSASLLHLDRDYAVKELEVQEGDWVADRRLDALRLADEGIVVLGIQRSTGAWVGAPRRETCVRAGDLLLVYGRERSLAQLDRRRDGIWGDREHRTAVEELRAAREREEQREQRLEASVVTRPAHETHASR